MLCGVLALLRCPVLTHTHLAIPQQLQLQQTGYMVTPAAAAAAARYHQRLFCEVCGCWGCGEDGTWRTCSCSELAAVAVGACSLSAAAAVYHGSRTLRDRAST